MTQAEALQQAAQRLDAAVHELENYARQVFAAGEGAISVADMKEQLRYLAEERDQLLRDLDAERERVRRLTVANEEVSGRLETVMGTLREMLPSVPG